jgi:hypothetical protein
MGRAISLDSVVVTENISWNMKSLSAQQVVVLTDKEILQNPGINPFDILITKPAIDGIAPSMGTKTINTKGFNSAAPIRMLQIIDGIDNQSPGLNFSLGTFWLPQNLIC